MTQETNAFFEDESSETLERFRSLIDNGKIKLEVSGREIIFRVPDMEDFIAVDKEYPLLPGMEAFEDAIDEEAEAGSRKSIETMLAQHFEDPEKQQRFVDRVKRLLCLCAMSPTLTIDFPLEPKEGELPVRALKDQDRTHAFVLLQAMSDFNAEAAVELVPFSDGSSFSHSTQSASVTGDSLPKS